MNNIINRGVVVCCLLLAVFFLQCSKKDDIAIETVLEIINYYPNSGKAGTLVTVSGSGFGTTIGRYGVTFGGVTGEVIGLSEDALVFRAPEEGLSGEIVLSYDGQQKVVGKYTYQDLSVLRLDPNRAQVGAHLRIYGAGFGSMKHPATVEVNGFAAEVMNANDTLLVVEVPKEGTGSGPVVVKVDGKESTGPIFNFMAIRSVKPMTGGTGTLVTISGEGFEAIREGNEVTFNGQKATVMEANATKLVVKAPEEVKTGPIVVSVDGTVIIGPEFTSIGLPTIGLVKPLSGPVGTEVTVRGDNYSPYTDETNVVIDGVRIVPKSVTNTEIKFIVPEGLNSGNVRILVNDRYSSDGPLYKAQNLGITGFSPMDGWEGTVVTVSGTGFSSVASENMVLFDGKMATVQSATTSSLKVVVPANVSSGRIQVSNDGQQALSAKDFHRAGMFTLADQSNGLQLPKNGGSLAVDNNNNVYVTDYSNNRIIKITASGQVSLFAGSTSGAEGLRNGQGDQALFRLSADAGLVFDGNQYLYVSDSRNQSLRRISLSGQVSTVIEQINMPIGKLNIHPNGQLYISANEKYLAVVDPTNGSYRTPIGSGTLSFRPVVMPGVNAYGYADLYDVYSMVESFNRSRIIYHTGLGVPMGQRTMDAFGQTNAGYKDDIGRAALFNQVRALCLDQNSLLVLDAGNYAMRRIDLKSNAVQTEFKLPTGGYENGDFRTARMSIDVWDMVVGKDGVVYILDSGNNAVRKVYLR